MCGQTHVQRKIKNRLNSIAVRNCVDRMQTTYISGKISFCVDKTATTTTKHGMGPQLFCYD